LKSSTTSIARVDDRLDIRKAARDANATFAVSGQPVARWKNSELVVKRPPIGQMARDMP
jgi:hypothetical protein